ncbi:MAG TPA: hypothetical protein VN921_03915 [Chthoniobacterales bacterium]|nr:hypothetical protein [Chthoniobacterales bacterium]
MAEPKKETVRIALPPRAAPKDGGQNGGAKDTTRIVLPSRTPVIPPRRLPPTIAPITPALVTASESPTISLRRPPVPPPSPLLRPLPKPPGIIREPEEATSSIAPPADAQTAEVEPGPKKETARITILPKPVAPTKPAVNMTKTQPLIMRPVGSAPVSPITVVTSRPVHGLDLVPRSFCWGLFGISALTLLIQIWNYFSS